MTHRGQEEVASGGGAQTSSCCCVDGGARAGWCEQLRQQLPASGIVPRVKIVSGHLRVSSLS